MAYLLWGLISLGMNQTHHLFPDDNAHSRTSVLLPITSNRKMCEQGLGQGTRRFMYRRKTLHFQAQVLTNTHPLGKWISLLTSHRNHVGIFDKYRCLGIMPRDCSLISLECSLNPIAFLRSSSHAAEPSA